MRVEICEYDMWKVQKFCYLCIFMSLHASGLLTFFDWDKHNEQDNFIREHFPSSAFLGNVCFLFCKFVKIFNAGNLWANWTKIRIDIKVFIFDIFLKIWVKTIKI